MLPEGSGFDLCKELRLSSTMPIIVLSALDEEEQKVRALRAGADDYLTKPFSTKELLARLAAIFRRVVSNSGEATLTINGLKINFAAHRVLRNGRDVNLTPIEFELLCMLARNRGRPMPAARCHPDLGRRLRRRHTPPAHPHSQPPPQDRGPSNAVALHQDPARRRLPVLRLIARRVEDPSRRHRQAP